MDKTKFHKALKRVGIEPHVDSLTFEYYRGKRQIPFGEIESIQTCKARVNILQKFTFWSMLTRIYFTPSRTSYITKKLDYRKAKGISIKLKNGAELFKNVGEIDLITTNAALDELNEMIWEY